MSYFSYISDWLYNKPQNSEDLKSSILSAKDNLKPALARNFPSKGIPPANMIVLSQNELDLAISRLKKVDKKPKIYFGYMNDVIGELRSKFIKRNFRNLMQELLEFFRIKNDF